MGDRNWRNRGGEMRTLEFTASGQELKAEKDCSFKGIVRGTKGYLQLRFTFDSEWDGFLKVAEFRKYLTDEAVPAAIINGRCDVPCCVTDGNAWRVNVVGKNGWKRLTTNTVTVKQEV